MDIDSDSSSDPENNETDRELQIAFQKGLLKSGLNVAVPAPPKFLNNAEGLTQALKDFKKDLPWIERLDLVTDPAPAPRPIAEQLGEDPDDLDKGEGVHDDFKREMKFYRQAQAAALLGLERLHKLGLPTKRPEDYFAEMAKTDLHMKKVREKLISKQVSKDRAEKVRKLRDMRKYGKKVQQEVLLKRQKEKKDMLDSVKKYRKGQQTKLDFLDDTKSQQGQKKEKKGNETHQPNKRRQMKNQNYGFGGQKKRSKLNTADSASEYKDFSIKKNSARPGHKGGAKKGGAKSKPGNKNRPGKARRQKSKGKGR